MKSVHSDERDFKCDSCEKAYKFNYDLKQHKKSVHEGIVIQCQKCEKSYTQRCHLARHIKIAHNDTKKETEKYQEEIICIFCKTRFIKQQELKEHLHLDRCNTGSLISHCIFSFSYFSPKMV